MRSYVPVKLNSTIFNLLFHLFGLLKQPSSNCHHFSPLSGRYYMYHSRTTPHAGISPLSPLQNVMLVAMLGGLCTSAVLACVKQVYNFVLSCTSSILTAEYVGL